MKENNLKNIELVELTEQEALHTNGGIFIALMIAFGVGYFLGRWAGGHPVWED